MRKSYDEKKKAVYITASLNDFDGDVPKWKEAFYELWRYQMTWDYAWQITVNESRSDGVYVRIIASPAYKKNLVDLMEYIGYRNITVADTFIGEVSAFDRTELEDIELLVLEY